MLQFHHSTRGLFAALALMTLGACASGPEAPAQPRQSDSGERVTGSNIPRRDGRAANGVKTMSADDLQNTSTPGGTAR
jgi:hypothetical protein